MRVVDAFTLTNELCASANDQPMNETLVDGVSPCTAIHSGPSAGDGAIIARQSIDEVGAVEDANASNSPGGGGAERIGMRDSTVVVVVVADISNGSGLVEVVIASSSGGSFAGPVVSMDELVAESAASSKIGREEVGIPTGSISRAGATSSKGMSHSVERVPVPSTAISCANANVGGALSSIPISAMERGVVSIGCSLPRSILFERSC